MCGFSVEEAGVTKIQLCSSICMEGCQDKEYRIDTGLEMRNH